MGIEVVELDGDRRLTLSARLTEGLEWLDRSSSGTYLARLDEPGRFSLLPLNGNWTRIEAKREELYSMLPDEEAEKALLILEDRYRKVRIEKMGRLTLPLILASFLFGPNYFDSRLFVVRRASHLELWSSDFRNRKLSKSSDLLTELP